MTVASKSRPIRILLVAASIRYMGGQAIMADRLIKDLRTEGLQVDFLPVDPEFPSMLEFSRKIKFVRTIVSTVLYVFSLFCRTWRYDVIHVFSASYWSFLISPSPAVLVGRLFRKSVILHYHSGEAKDHLKRSGMLTHWLLRLPKRIVVPSGYLVDVFAEFGFQAMAIPNHMERRDAIFRRRAKLTPKIIVPRALEDNYGIPCAVRAFEILKSQIPEAEMTILGEGSHRDLIESMIDERDIKGITLAGRVERAEIWQSYNAHDIFLNTSIVDNMPISILEAFAAGLPIVTTNAGGIPYMIENDRNGCLVNIDDYEAAAQNMMELLSNPEKALRLADNGHSSLDQYEWEQVGKQWKELFQQLAGFQGEKEGLQGFASGQQKGSKTGE